MYLLYICLKDNFNIDNIESLAKERLIEIFNKEYRDLSN